MNERSSRGVAEAVGSEHGRPALAPEWLWGIINAAQLIWTLVWTALGISLALLVRLVSGSERFPLRMASWLWSPVLLRGAGARLEVSGLENVDFSRPHLFVANHESMIEVCALFMAVPVPLRFMLKASLGRVPFLGWYTRAMGMVLLRRGDPSAVSRQLDRAAGLLRNGHSLAAFPEGTRSRDGSVGPFKSGAFRVAIAAGVPVVPVAVAGSGRVMPPGGFRIRPGCIRLHFGQPIDTQGLSSRQRLELARQARREVVELRNHLA